MNVRRLHIGALRPTPGWESLNTQSLEGISHVCDARDLSRFLNGTFDCIYASHVLEHFDYLDEVSSVLTEWYRVLAPGGHLYVSVPDLDIICRLYCDQIRFDANDRFMMMRMIMGGHCDRYDYHKVAFNQDFLVHYLAEAGFDKIRRIADFGIFEDTSSLRFKGELISLNLIAEKPFLIRQTSASESANTIETHIPVQLESVTTNLDTPIESKAVQRFITISTEKVIKLHEAGHTNEAIAQYANILSLYPDNEEVIFKLARLYLYADRAEEALPLLKCITSQSHFYADALFLLGKTLGERRDFAGGVNCLTSLLEIDDNRVECYNNLARFLIELGRPEKAHNYLQRSIQTAPNFADTYNYLGNLFMRYWRLSEAGDQYRRVIELQPDNAVAFSNLAWIVALEGNVAEAIAMFHKALSLRPDFRIAASNLLFTLNYSDNYTPEQVHEEHLRLADIYSCPVPELKFRQHRPGGKIRVGYVSGDFRAHSVAIFFEPVLSHHKREDFEIFCYDMVSVPDETTNRMMNLSCTWRPIYGLSDIRVAEQVRSDGIDILVDLAGHTEGNRLGVFALQPAPWQVTWLGYPNTTGLSQIDFRLTDALADPPGITDHLYSECLIRLPRSFLCYAPPILSPEVVPLQEGPITFCCFNNFPKISDTTIQLWSRVLHALPDSLLLLKNGSLGDAGVRDQLIGRFADHGIESPRLILAARSVARDEHLQRYGACHIALDTFPYNGTTTTCEALWMGLPVVSLAGDIHASRVGVSILTNAGAPELIASSCDQYVEISTSLGRNPERLQRYRKSLREQLLGSSLMSASTFTVELEQVYRWMMKQPITDLG